MVERMKAMITDLDWTLLRTDKTVSEYTRTILKKCHEKGILLMAATARPERAVFTYRNQIDFDAVTTLNGARIILPHGIIENGMKPSSAETILKKAVMIPGLVISSESIIYKILLENSENDIRQEVEKFLTEDTYMTVSEGKLIQIMSKAATKWNGIKTMLEAAGVKQNEAVYFGDDYDDIESIKNCGVGVAVSNAIDEVLDAADLITESNDMDGVARYIEKNLLHFMDTDPFQAL